MRVFESDRHYSNKVNFVDDNNVFVGFDYSQGCCEDFGWFLTRTKPVPDVEAADADKIEGEDFPGYNFDTSFNEGELYPNYDHNEGGSVTFRLTNGTEEMFLTLYNHHNGYYGHGWEMKNGGEDGTKIQDGCL